jgi:hypothetical protein
VCTAPLHLSSSAWADRSQAFNNATAAFYASPAFAAKQAEAKAFLGALPPYLDGRNVSLQNMVCPQQNIDWEGLRRRGSGTSTTT